MKILFLDFLYPNGHTRLNTLLIEYLSSFSNVIVPIPDGHYEKVALKAEVIEDDVFKIEAGKVRSRLSTLRIMWQSAALVRKKKPDYIFISSYDTLTFAIGRLFFPRNQKIFLLHHNNIDQLSNRIKRWAFSSYLNKVKHLVFEDFIKSYLMDKYNLNGDSIQILPHPLYINSVRNDDKPIYDCVGLSNSNNETIISQIIELEKKEAVFSKGNRKVILKSKTQEFDNGNLKIVRGYLNSDLYDHYINNSRSIYIPFPLSYKNRMSGTLVDALSNEKIVFGSDIPLIKSYSLKYPEICKVVYGTEDIVYQILNIGPIAHNTQLQDFENFKDAHSEERIKGLLYKMFIPVK